ncbi:MAG TPA: hypothetical protein VHT91_45105, partial [Kofleriaceae bacterium]|nr:hypothetical protein [Kofleriaceae bacterium]
MNLEGLPDAERPRLKVRDGSDAAKLILAAVAPSVVAALPCPYPEMRPYAADDAASFHGRDAEIQDLLGRLRAGEREITVTGNTAWVWDVGLDEGHSNNGRPLPSEVPLSLAASRSRVARRHACGRRLAPASSAATGEMR